MSLFSKLVSSVLLVNGFAMAGNGLLLGAGLNLSDFSYSEDPPSDFKTSMRTGFNLGAGFDIGITPMFSIIPGLALETRGLVVKQSDPDFGDFKTELKYMYLEVPVLAQVNIPAGNGFLNLFAGPEIGFLLSAKAKLTGDTEDGSASETIDIKDDTKGIDFGIHFGIGFEFPVGPGAIAIRPGYSIGLTHIVDSEPDPEFPEEPEEPEVKVKHLNIKLAVAYKISL
jgi:hypothetical protein